MRSLFAGHEGAAAGRMCVRPAAPAVFQKRWVSVPPPSAIQTSSTFTNS